MAAKSPKDFSPLTLGLGLFLGDAPKSLICLAAQGWWVQPSERRYPEVPGEKEAVFAVGDPLA